MFSIFLRSETGREWLCQQLHQDLYGYIPHSVQPASKHALNSKLKDLELESRRVLTYARMVKLRLAACDLCRAIWVHSQPKPHCRRPLHFPFIFAKNYEERIQSGECVPVL